MFPPETRSTWGFLVWRVGDRLERVMGTQRSFTWSGGCYLQNLARTINCWLDKGIATHSTVLAWRIPWTEEPGRLQSIALHRVRHDWSDVACTHSWTAGSIPKVFSRLPQGDCSPRMLSPDLCHWMVLLPASQDAPHSGKVFSASDPPKSATVWTRVLVHSLWDFWHSIKKKNPGVGGLGLEQVLLNMVRE